MALLTPDKGDFNPSCGFPEDENTNQEELCPGPAAAANTLCSGYLAPVPPTRLASNKKVQNTTKGKKEQSEETVQM